MNKLAWLCAFLVVFAYARENPFETTGSALSSGKTTHIKENKTEFESAKITLPSSARILKSVSVAFQNLDGSISEEIVSIEQNVNWHEPLILSRKADENKTKTPTVLSNALLGTKKVDEKKSIQEIPLPQNILPQIKDKTITLTENISFEIVKNDIKILTKDIKIRDLLVSEPYKVVIDFKKESSYPTKTVLLENPPFVSATLGNHDGFYRIVILLDGHYRYDLQSVDGGYSIKLK